MKNRNIIDSFKNAFSGIFYCIRNERNIKIHIAAACVALLLGFLLNITRFEFLILCMAIGFVIVSEMFNTAVEVIADLMVKVYHPKVKVIKDVSAGAVMVSALFSMTVGYIIFFDRIIAVIVHLLGGIR